MRKIFTPFVIVPILVLVSSRGFCQSKSEIEAIRKKMWELKEADFKTTEVPDKWKNESAVILCRSLEYEVKKEVFLLYVQENLYTRNRIKLLDEAAVKEYSEMSFQASKFVQSDAFGSGDTKNVFVGIKVRKPNGEEKEIPTSEAVTMEVKAGSHKEKYDKMAIPDLEPGDIIDYYYCVEKRTLLDDFGRVLYPLADKYPIVKQKLDLHIMRKCYVNAAYLNGAPAFQVKSEKDDDVYTIVDKDREKIDPNHLWFFENRSVPTINLKAYYIRKKTGWADYWVGKQGEVRTRIPEDKLLKFINYLGDLPTSRSKMKKYYPAANSVLSYVKKHHKQETNPEVLANEAYNMLRQRKFAVPYEREAVYGHKPMYGYGMGEYEFIASMSIFLKKKKIDHDFVIAIPRTLSDTKELALSQDAFYMLRINASKPFFIRMLSSYNHPCEVGENFEGVEAYAVNMLQKEKKRTLKKISIPASTSEMNSEDTQLKVKLDVDNLEELTVQRTVSSKGYNRFLHSAKVINAYDYLYDGRFDQYDLTLLENERGSKKEKAETARKIEQRKEQDNKNRLEKMKASLEEELDAKVVSYDQITLKQTGIWVDKPTLVYQDEYKLGSLIASAGTGYLFEVGKLIGKQIDLTKEQLSRTYDIYMPYARSFNYTIDVQIPAGYTVKGLEKLNYRIVNQSGGFVSQAKLEGNTLNITTRKYYAHHFEKAATWPEMTAFMEAAYAFTQQKLLLQKTAHALNNRNK